jgi:hypothetical protein
MPFSECAGHDDGSVVNKNTIYVEYRTLIQSVSRCLVPLDDGNLSDANIGVS